MSGPPRPTTAVPRGTRPELPAAERATRLPRHRRSGLSPIGHRRLREVPTQYRQFDVAVPGDLPHGPASGLPVVRRTGRSSELLPPRVCGAQALARRGALLRHRGPVPVPARTRQLTGRLRRRRRAGRRARRPAGLGRIHPAVGGADDRLRLWGSVNWARRFGGAGLAPGTEGRGGGGGGPGRLEAWPAPSARMVPRASDGSWLPRRWLVLVQTAADL